MNTGTSMEQQFVQKLIEVIDTNLHNENFGVTELAAQLGMNRVTLHRKVKSIVKKSVSEFIRETRLTRAHKLLQQKAGTVSEIAYQVGFGSTTYFTKCFHDYYGYPPGEAIKHSVIKDDSDSVIQPVKKRRTLIIYSVFFLVLVAFVLFVVVKPFSFQQTEMEKSILVLPILNYDGDSTNNFITEGLHEEIINKLQLIKEIRVISRTTSVTYKNTDKTSKEIARELGVNYILEGSSQNINGITRIRLQLIDASSEKSIWGNPYERELSNEKIFEIQQEIAAMVAKGIKAKISPLEKKEIATPATENTIAYRYYIQGLSYARMFGRDYKIEDLYRAKGYFSKALEQDSTYSKAMFELAWLLIHETWANWRKVKNEKWDSAIILADRAIKFDAQFPDGYALKAFLTRHNEKEKRKALEMAVKTGPELISGYGGYAIFYFFIKKEYANAIKYYLKTYELALDLDPIIPDWILYQISASFAVTQFENIAENFINLLSQMQNQPAKVSALRQLNQIMGRNYEQAIEIGLQLYNTWPNNLTTLDYLGQSYLFMDDLEMANFYYSKYITILKSAPEQTFPVFPRHRSVFIEPFLGNWPKNGLIQEIFPVLHMMYIQKKLGNTELAETYRQVILDNINEMIKGKNDVVDLYSEDENYVLETYFADYKLACLYATFDENDKAIEHIKNLAIRKPVPVWLVNYVKDNPMLDPIREHPDFIRVVKYMEKEYDKEKKKIEKLVEEYQTIIP